VAELEVMRGMSADGRLADDSLVNEQATLRTAAWRRMACHRWAGVGGGSRGGLVLVQTIRDAKQQGRQGNLALDDHGRMAIVDDDDMGGRRGPSPHDDEVFMCIIGRCRGAGARRTRGGRTRRR
jgi:hypothetical protein